LNSLDQSDPKLISYIQRQLVIPPAPANLPYNLKKPNEKDGSQGQLKVVLDIFKNKVLLTVINEEIVRFDLDDVEKWDLR
jgi:hypothetical protein